MIDVMELTAQLVRHNTINPPGNEEPPITELAAILDDAGFAVSIHAFEPGRPSLVARREGAPGSLPICFTGHVDVVPLGATPWDVDPFGAHVEGDRIYGRGTSDMKAGVAAMVVAAQALKGENLNRGLTLVLTAGEEKGTQGAKHLVALGQALGEAGAVVVGEPTGNVPSLGHKGLLWLSLSFAGVTAHSSMPHEGENAIFKMAAALTRLERFRFDTVEHPLLGGATLNIGTCEGGININSVPASAGFTVDVRTLPGMNHHDLVERICAVAGEGAVAQVLQDELGFVSEPRDAFIQGVVKICAAVTGKRHPLSGVPYFTDGAPLYHAYGGPPTVICGPGELAMAHKRNEYCHISRIHESRSIYEQIMRQWCLSGT